MAPIAKLAIQSNLPQLDRLFDYQIPERLNSQVKIGSKVKAAFGRIRKPLEAFVVEISKTSEFKGNLSEVVEVIGDTPLLRPNIFDLCRMLADRAACNLGELLSIAVPAHMPRVYQGFMTRLNDNPLAENFGDRKPSQPQESREFVLAEPKVIPSPVEGNFNPAWVSHFVLLAQENVRSGLSSILVVPDFRESEVLIKALEHAGLGPYLVNYSQDQTKSKQYEAFLSCLMQDISIVVGSRSAAFAPCNNLGTIAMFDEGDPSYSDQSSPYLNTRDVVLVRQSIERCSIVFSSHSMSTDMMRLIQSGYVTNKTKPFPNPKVSMSEPGLRIDWHAHLAIKKALEFGPVLVQVSSLGDSTALYCKSCDLAATCNKCHGPLWKDSQGHLRCRWCNSFALDHVCSCGGKDFNPGRPGSTRTAAELGRMFPQARVIEATGEKRLTSISSQRTLVVATPGSEPYAEGGYQSVVILDAHVALARQRLRALEEAVRVWSNAIAKLRPEGNAVLVGLESDFGSHLALWNHPAIAAKELSSRTELRLPPVVRMGSISGAQELVTKAAELMKAIPGVQCIGPAPVAFSDQWKLMFKYQHSQSAELGKSLKVELAKIAAGKTRTLSSGRVSRALTIKMNESEVL